jgi:hypothetical protein
MVRVVGTPARGRSRSALYAAGVLVLGCIAGARVPASWHEVAPSRPSLTEAGPLGPLWTTVAHAVPIGELAQRADLLAVAVVAACALASVSAAYRLFRGPGRWLAAVATGPVVALALLAWLREAGPVEALRQLPPTLAATIGIAAAVRSLVHFGFVAPVARTRALAAAGFAALLEPRIGLPLMIAIAAASVWVPARHRHETGGWRGAVASLVIGVLPIALALVVAVLVVGGAWAWPDPLSLRLRLPSDPLLGGHLPAAAIYAGLALLGLLVVPLRWRGGLVLALLGAAGFFVHDARGPLAPMPAMLVLVGTAAAGWIWLAGSAAPRDRPRLGRVLAACATPVALLLTVGPVLLEVTPRGPVADDRPIASVHRVYEKGLVAPGDAVVTYGVWTRMIAEAREVSGWRPDVTTISGDALGGSELMRLAIEIDSSDRRLLSNSFNAAGKWSASWVLDSGPLFWFVGPGLPDERELTDLSRFMPDLSTLSGEERSAWLLLIAERARYRRAIGEPAAALEAMPLSPESYRGMHTRLQLATNARPSAGPESELPALPSRLPDDPRVLWAGEGGDLLYAHGERERAAELLAESAAGGWAPALGALARWQFRAGEDEAARRTIVAMAEADATRHAAIEMIPWLLARQRSADAELLLSALVAGGHTDPAQELTARLHLVSAQALEPPPTLPRPDPQAFSQR